MKPGPPHTGGLKLLHGVRKPMPQSGWNLRAKLPKPPEHVKGLALQIWNEVGRVLQEARVICELDRGSFACLCITWARTLELQSALERYEPGAKESLGLARLLISQQKLLHSLQVQFGLTPASRDKMQPQEKIPESNPWADFPGAPE